MADKNCGKYSMGKSMRSVYIGNVPYRADEEMLKEICSQVGPVVSLKLIYDVQSGESKGYGFCEYTDNQMALSAIRNLNGYEFYGRKLLVDIACDARPRKEMRTLSEVPPAKGPYGKPCDPDKAPEIISETVVSMSPSQLYEAMREMSQLAQENPDQARQMLMLNPPLSYALLQGLVLMKIVNPEAALSMLSKANDEPPVVGNKKQGQNMPMTNVMPQTQPEPQPLMLMPAARSVPVPNFNVIPNGDVDFRAMLGPNSVCQGIMDPYAMAGHNFGWDINWCLGPSFPPHMGPRALPSYQRRASRRRCRFIVNIRQIPSPLPLPPPPQKEETEPQQADNDLAEKSAEQEKAELIAQVMLLTDEQLATVSPYKRAQLIWLREKTLKGKQE